MKGKKVERFNGMMETREILNDPEALKDIAKALKEFEKGEYVEL